MARRVVTPEAGPGFFGWLFLLIFLAINAFMVVFLVTDGICSWWERRRRQREASSGRARSCSLGYRARSSLAYWCC